MLNDKFVSRHHGEIYFRNGEFFIRDLGRVKMGLLSMGNVSMEQFSGRAPELK